MRFFSSALRGHGLTALDCEATSNTTQRLRHETINFTILNLREQDRVSNIPGFIVLIRIIELTLANPINPLEYDRLKNEVIKVQNLHSRREKVKIRSKSANAISRDSVWHSFGKKFQESRSNSHASVEIEKMIKKAQTHRRSFFTDSPALFLDGGGVLSFSRRRYSSADIDIEIDYREQ